MTTLAASGLLAGTLARAELAGFPVVRPLAGRRRFRSQAVEETIAWVGASTANRGIAWMFDNP